MLVFHWFVYTDILSFRPVYSGFIFLITEYS